MRLEAELFAQVSGVGVLGGGMGVGWNGWV